MDFISLSSAHILTPALENNQTYGREITLLGNSADYNIRTSRNSLAYIAHTVDAVHIADVCAAFL
jgi:hypothetical protein